MKGFKCTEQTRTLSYVLFTVYFLYGMFKIPFLEYATCLSIGAVIFGITNSIEYGLLGLLIANLILPMFRVVKKEGFANKASPSSKADEDTSAAEDADAEDADADADADENVDNHETKIDIKKDIKKEETKTKKLNKKTIDIDTDNIITNTIEDDEDDENKDDKTKVDKDGKDGKDGKQKSELVINNIEEVNLNLDELETEVSNDFENNIDLDELQSVDFTSSKPKEDPNTKFIFFKDIE